MKPHAFSLLARLQCYPTTPAQKQKVNVQELVQLYCYCLDLKPFEEGRQVALFLLQKHSTELKPHMASVPQWLGKHADAFINLIQDLIGAFDPTKVPITPSMLAEKGNFASVAAVLEALYAERASGDFDIIIKGAKPEKVHSYVMYARWPYFRQMYDANMKEKRQGKLALPASNEDGGMAPELLQLIIALCYKPNMLRDNSGQIVTLPVAIQLLSISDLYFLDLGDESIAGAWKSALEVARVVVVKNMKALEEEKDPLLRAIKDLPGPSLFELLRTSISQK
jgi:hypothetical protein